MNDVRITDTNSVNDSRGRALGLEGNDFVIILVALVAAFGLFLVLNIGLRFGFLAAVLLTMPVFVGPLLWVLCLRHNRPEGYAEDFWEDLFDGEGWSLATQPLAWEGAQHTREETSHA